MSFPGSRSPFFIVGVIFMGGMIDKQKLSMEVIDMLIDNGLEEPWLMAIVDSFILRLENRSEVEGIVFGFADDKPFVCLEIGLLQNVFEVDYPDLNYYLISSNTGFYDKVLSIDMPAALSQSSFALGIDSLMKYLSIQIDMGSLLDGGMTLEEFDKRLADLL